MVQQLWASRAVSFISSHHCFVIDLRSREEFRSGHLPKAVQIEPEELESGEYPLAKSIPIVIYCDSGGESLRIARLLSMRGYLVYNIAGGYDAYARQSEREK
jgi:rhodanese-related sulfurtransferase